MPPPKILSYYGHGGWNAAKKRNLDAIILPVTTRCFECNKVKNTTVAFSEKQQNDLRNGLASGQVPVKTGKAWITCRDCIGTQHTEMQCVVCERFKGLDGFAKSQRRNPDNARCKTCIAEVANTIPHEANQSGEGDEHSDGENDSDDSQSNIYGSSVNDTEDLDSDSGVTLPSYLTTDHLDKLNTSRAGNAQAASGKTSTTASMAGTEYTSNQRPAGVKDWQAMSRRNQFTAYDAQGVAHTKDVNSASSDMSDDSEATTAYAGQVIDPKPTSKFAKVPACLRPVPVPEHDGGRNVSYDSDDDDDDNDFFTV